MILKTDFSTKYIIFAGCFWLASGVVRRGHNWRDDDVISVLFSCYVSDDTSELCVDGCSL